MTKEETRKLFLLLGSLWPGSRLAKPSEEILLAWFLALEPYPWAEMRQAAIYTARASKFPPDIADLTVYCPEIPEAMERARKDAIRVAQAQEDLADLRRLLGKGTGHEDKDVATGSG